MKSRYIYPIALLFAMMFTFDSYGQPPRGEKGKAGLRQPGKKKERVQQLKIAYFTQELDLTSEEAEKFWPIYNEMSENVQTEKRKSRAATRALKQSMDTMSDTEVKAKMNEALEARIKEAELQKEYLNKIGAVIGFKKAAKVVSLEAQFKRELLKRLSEQKNSDSNANEE